jgi:TPR repeat protein
MSAHRFLFLHPAAFLISLLTVVTVMGADLPARAADGTGTKPTIESAARPVPPERAASKAVTVRKPTVKPVTVRKPVVAPVKRTGSPAKPRRSGQAAPAAGAPRSGGFSAAAIAAAGLAALPALATPELNALDQQARAGDAAAQLDYAERLAAGELGGLPQLPRALYWYEQAANGGEADASWALANLYRNGLGLPVDYTAALGWYQKAAGQGHAEAMYDLGLLYTEGGAVAPDAGLAAEWFEKAADAGIARAHYMLGILYERGVDGAPDLDAAAGWFRRAAETGDATALAAVKRLAAGGSNVSVVDLPGGALGPAKGGGAQTVTAPAAARVDNARRVPVDQGGVREIQTLLRRAGFPLGRPDGHLGKRTAEAIKAYQKKQRLPVDGRATQALLQHLRKTVSG